MSRILYLIAAVLIALWIVGFVFRYIVSPLIHLALVIALAVIVYQFATGRRRV